MLDERGSVRFSISPSTLYRDLGSGGILLQLDEGAYFSVEGTANRAWQVLAATRDLQQVFRTLAEEYDVDPRELAADLEAFVLDLTERQLITPGTGRASK